MGEKLTREQHARLAAELAELEGPKRREMVEAISAARAHGDLSENFEYHAAKNEQGLLERRIVILRDRFDHAEIVEDGAADVVSEGSHVVVADESGARVDVEISALGGAGTVSPSSPLGSVVLGKRVGDDGRRPGAERLMASDDRRDPRGSPRHLIGTRRRERHSCSLVTSRAAAGRAGARSRPPRAGSAHRACEGCARRGRSPS